MRLTGAAAAAVVALAAGATRAAPPADDAVVWNQQPALVAAATAAAGDGSRAEVRGDPGLGCFATTLSAATRDGDLAAVDRGFRRALTEAGATLEAEGGDGGVRFVLGRYHGVARMAVTPERAEMSACMCADDRYPVEDACASLP